MKGSWFVLAFLAPISLPVPAACWQPEVAASSVRFVAVQAGAPVEGRFTAFSGRLCIDEAPPNEDRVELSIDTASVDMGMPEFDDAMRGPDFLDSARWPRTRFASARVTPLGAGRYRVTGRLTVRDKARDIEVPFSMARVDGRVEARGETTIRRLEFDLGLGEWSDTRWIGADVTVKFRVILVAE